MTQNIPAHVSGAIIKISICKKNFSIMDVHSEINLKTSSDQIRQILKQLEADGWVETNINTYPELESWKSGPLAREYGDMVKFSRESEGTIPVLPGERIE